MAEKLFPVVKVPDFAEQKAEYDRRYKRSVKWDAAKGDFVRDGANRMVECSGRDAFFQWCFKTAQTERYRCMAYPDVIGTEMEKALADDDEKTVESMVQRTITDALMVNPRTEYVRNFNFIWDKDKMNCEFSVKGRDMEELFTITI